MKYLAFSLTLLLGLSACFSSCEKDEEPTDTTDPMDGETMLHPAFEEFDVDNLTIMLDDDEVVIESNGLPNHTSPYWSNTTARPSPDGTGPATDAADSNHPLWVAPA
ncbi:MAG: YHYH protein, partial [Saprospiraceae bacterium]